MDKWSQMDGTNGETEGKQWNWTNGQMGQMEDKWTDKWRKYGKGTDLAGMGQMGERMS
jgi:hypothetical protein